MRTYLNERNIVTALFITALITFSLAQEDSRKFDKTNSTTKAVEKVVPQPVVKQNSTPVPTVPVH